MIAFVAYRDGNSEIYVMNWDGSGETRLTNDAAIDNAPAWSPDGTKIAFTSTRDGNWEIYTMNADGSMPTRLTSNTQDVYQPDWSPDGMKIVFSRLLSGHDYNIVAINGNNRSVATQLTSSIAPELDPDWGQLPLSLSSGNEPPLQP